jgi:hypothetical protein
MGESDFTASTPLPYLQKTQPQVPVQSRLTPAAANRERMLEDGGGREEREDLGEETRGT